MSGILKIRLPFFRRKTNGGSDGLATFYLDQTPRYLPQVNEPVIITHNEVANGTGLKTKLNSISTNTVVGRFQSVEVNTVQESVQQADGFSSFMILQYDDFSFSTSQFSGDCRGFIEYYVNPEQYSILKPVESTVIVNETIPFDLNDGINIVSHSTTTPVTSENLLKGMFIKRKDTNTVFSNLLKSLGVPVSDDEMKKYTRSQLGRLTQTTSNVFDTIIDNVRYVWSPFTGTTTTENLVVHPKTGWIGENYGTALQSIGSHEFVNNQSLTPIENELYLVFEIPNNQYGEIIDGKTIEFRLPYFTPTTNPGSGTTLESNRKLGVFNYSTTATTLIAYGTYNRKNIQTINLDRVTSEIDLSVKDIGIEPDLNNPNRYESNIVLLFSDDIKRPQNNSNFSWSSGYADLLDGTRVFSPNSQEKQTYDNSIDTCIGYAVLDKGFIVITHPIVVDSYFRNIFNGSITVSNANILSESNKNYDVNGTPSTSNSRGFIITSPNHMITTLDENNNIVWDSSQFAFVTQTTGTLTGITSSVRYISYNTEKSLNVVCLASSDEFFRSTNDTAKEFLGVDQSEDFASFKTEDQDLYPTIITEIGIHDADGNLLAICKPSQPIKKYWYDVVSFNIKIRL